MNFLVGHRAVNAEPNPQDGVELASFRDALLQMIGDVKSEFDPDTDYDADNLVWELEELLPVFDQDGNMDRAAWDANAFADPFRDMIDNCADQVTFNTGATLFWMFRA